jgi:RNA polymerase sigma factor (sigma-70 family)
MDWARRGALQRTADHLLAEDAAEQAVHQLLAVAARGRVPLDIRAWLARVAEHQVGRLAQRPEWRLRAKQGEELLASVPDRAQASKVERLQANRREARDRSRRQRLRAALKKLAALEKKTVELVLLQGIGLHAAATRLGADRSYLRRILKHAAAKLRKWLR